MVSDESDSGSLGRAVGCFATTHWSVVIAAGKSDSPRAAKALETLCRSYWYPLYAYVRRRGYPPADAQDLTQEFFARFIEKGSFNRADPARGRFRSFLLKSLQHFLADEWKRVHRVKRGGRLFEVPLDGAEAEARLAVELTDNVTPERAYDERWAMALLELVLERLRQEYIRAGKKRLFDTLQDCLWEQGSLGPRAVLAKDLGLTEGAFHAAVHRLREQYRKQLRAEVAHTVDDPGQVDEELRYLIGVMTAGNWR